MNRKSLLLTLVCMILVCTTLTYDAMASTAELIASCTHCHGTKGVSTEKDMPTIAGMSAAFIEQSLFAYLDDLRPAQSGAYRSGDTTRPDTDMKTLTQRLSEQQIQQVSQYFSQQDFVAAEQTFEQPLAQIGKRIHQMKCEKCHEAGGSVAEDDSGLLSGQWTSYLKQSFADYRNKTRHSERKMERAVINLSDQEIQALLHFYASNKK